MNLPRNKCTLTEGFIHIKYLNSILFLVHGYFLKGEKRQLFRDMENNDRTVLQMKNR